MLHILQLHHFKTRHKRDKQYCTVLALLVIVPIVLLGSLTSHAGIRFTIETFLITKLLLNSVDSMQLIVRITIGAIKRGEF